VAAGLLLVALLPCGSICLRGSSMDRLAALELASLICVLIMLLLAHDLAQPPFYDLALTLALLGFPATLAFAKVFEQWL
jgi:multicomponent Na+:H+ antiporter subunit F